MAFDPTTTLNTIQTNVRTLTDYFESGHVFVGTPPKSVLPEAPSAVISMDSMTVGELTLTTTIEVHTVMIRIYRAQVAASENATELQLSKLIPALFDVFKGDFSIGGTIRAVDWGGIYGQSPRVDFDEEEIADKPYWTAHVVLPLIVDPTAEFVA